MRKSLPPTRSPCFFWARFKLTDFQFNINWLTVNLLFSHVFLQFKMINNLMKNVQRDCVISFIISMSSWFDNNWYFDYWCRIFVVVMSNSSGWVLWNDCMVCCEDRYYTFHTKLHRIIGSFPAFLCF